MSKTPFVARRGLDPAPWNSPTIPYYLGTFPMWHPEPERRGIFQISSGKAFAAGWTQRPFGEMATDYLWTFDQLGPDLHWTDELSPETEERVLEQWDRARTG